MATFFRSPDDIPLVLGAGATLPVVFLFLGTKVEPLEPALLAMLAAATRVRPEPPVEVEARGSDDDESRAAGAVLFPPPAPSAPPGFVKPRASRSAGAALLSGVGVGAPLVAVPEELEDVLPRLMLPLEERETGRMNDRRERDCVSVEDVSSIEGWRCWCWWCCLLLDCEDRRG